MQDPAWINMQNIASNLASIKERIAQYECKYQRKLGSVQLLAVSKLQTIDKIRAAFEAGQTCFGENYLQEALTKMASLADKAIEWHFIGLVQSNKTRKIAEHFDWVHSINHINIAKRLNEQRPAHLPPLNVCIEVNISHEKTKSGIQLEEVAALARACQHFEKLTLRGLMCIPANVEDFQKQRHEFHKLHALWQSLRDQGISVDTLSMGMSHDFEAAIAEGSTLVRIGTAIFGQRKST